VDEPGSTRRRRTPAKATAVARDDATPIDLPDPRAISILNAEMSSLVASRSLAYNEGFVRTGMFLTALSAALVALGFVAQALAFGEGFQMFAVLVLALVFVLGLTTLIRVTETGREDLRAVQGMNRIRHAWFEVCPEVRPYFITSDRDDIAGVVRTYEGPAPEESLTSAGSIVHGFGTAMGTVGLLVALVGGALAGVVAGALGVPFVAAVLLGVLAFVGLILLVLTLVIRSVVAFGASLDPRFPSDQPAKLGGPSADER
jgi:hypothetical protein